MVGAARFRLDLDHTEQLMRVVSAVTVDPLKNIFFYAFPFTRAMISNYVQMRRNDATQTAMMPTEAKEKILEEIDQLSDAAGLPKRKTICYTALNHYFGSYGGLCSLTKPTLYLPSQHLFRVGKPFFTQDPTETLAPDLWSFSDHQTRFLICRELAQIKSNSVLLRIIIKVTLVAAGFVFYATPLGWIGGATLLTIAAALYFFSERYFESRMDTRAVKILATRLENRPLAVEVARQTLEKMQNQNIARRTINPLSRLYTTRKGNNLLDLTHPFLTSRKNRIN